MILSNIKEAREIILAKQSTDSLNKELEEYSNAIKKLKNIKASISNYTISMIKLNKINNNEFPSINNNFFIYSPYKLKK